MRRVDPMSELDGQLRFANTAEAHEGHASGGLATSLVDLVENVFAVDEIGIAGEGDSREWGRRRFPSFGLYCITVICSVAF